MLIVIGFLCGFHKDSFCFFIRFKQFPEPYKLSLYYH